MEHASQRQYAQPERSNPTQLHLARCATPTVGHVLRASIIVTLALMAGQRYPQAIPVYWRVRATNT